MKWKKRTRGTPKQLGKPFPVGERKDLPRLQLKKWRLRKWHRKVDREALAKRMARKPADVYEPTFRLPVPYLEGTIQVMYDGEVLTNAIEVIPHDKWVGSWDKTQRIVYIDDDLPKKYWKSLAVHESVEKYLREKYGLDENAEGHEAAEEVERRRFCKESKCPADWDEYSKIVERVHRAEMKFAEKTGGKRKELRSSTAFAVCAKCGYEYNVRIRSKCPRCGSTIISAVRGGKQREKEKLYADTGEFPKQRITILDSVNMPIGYAQGNKLYTNRGEFVANVKEANTIKEIRDILLARLGRVI